MTDWCARVTMRAETLAIIAGGTAKKGDVLGVARLAFPEMLVELEATAAG